MSRAARNGPPARAKLPCLRLYTSTLGPHSHEEQNLVVITKPTYSCGATRHRGGSRGCTPMGRRPKAPSKSLGNTCAPKLDPRPVWAPHEKPLLRPHVTACAGDNFGPEGLLMRGPNHSLVKQHGVVRRKCPAFRPQNYVDHGLSGAALWTDITHNQV